MSGLLDEVRAFVSGLRRELPEVFVPAAPKPRPPRPLGPEAEAFSARCARFAPEMGVTFGKVRAKEMSSLWGSCSARGDLSFNRRLLAAPPEVLDYVVVHELAHLRWRGHGARFWALVEKHCPEQRAHRRWLRRNGAALLAGELPGPAVDGEEELQVPPVAGQLPRQGEVEAPLLPFGAAGV